MSSKLFSSDASGGESNEHACAAGAVRHRHGERANAILRADRVLHCTQGLPLHGLLEEAVTTPCAGP